MSPGYGHSLRAAAAVNTLVELCHGAAASAGWWLDKRLGPLDIELRDPTSRVGKALFAEKLCLIHSEVSEAMEGHRKGKMDEHLPHHRSEAVELADAVIRICDLAGAAQLDLAGALVDKMAYNAVRPDHKPEARAALGGKAY